MNWKMIYLARRNPGLKPEEFPQAWREHSALGAQCTNVKAKVLIKEKRDAVHQSLVRQLDTWENECIPKVTMSLNAVQFASVCYHTPQTRS